MITHNRASVLETQPPQGGIFLGLEAYEWSRVPAALKALSMRFYDYHDDLMPHGTVILDQVRYDTEQQCEQIRTLGRTGVRTVCFSAEKHIEDEELRTDGNNDKFHGTGIFGWQVVDAGESERTVLQIETRGSALHSVRKARFGFGGQLLGYENVDELEIYEASIFFDGLIQSQPFLEKVAALREKRASAIDNWCTLIKNQHTMPRHTFMIEEEKARLLVSKQALPETGFYNFKTVQQPISYEQQLALIQERIDRHAARLASKD
ncbi:MAG: hypothetical protein NTX11_02200 [Candidatus Saccharibacteria bacterium]|nr:hypothetical protein [Candidatus Saccharibacteria bacterium]